MGRGAEVGVLIKNAEALEKLEKVKTIVIDKTGTLTEGKPKLLDIPSKEILCLAAALEQNSEHPLGKAIVAAYNGPLPKVEEFKSIPGSGVTGVVDHKKIAIGKSNLGVSMTIEGKEVAQFTFADPIKKSTPQALKELQLLGITLVLLSGDNKQTTEKVALNLGIKEFYGEVNPAQKLELLRKLKGRNIVAMAGDGVNDAPALAAADVGIAMGTGTDVAIESAEITLVKGDLLAITRAIHLSRAVMKNIRQNLFFAFFYNAISIPLAAGLLYPPTGLLLNPMIAAFAMSLSSVSVILNSLRLKLIKI
jgi:Cu+-exporting ATPase